MKINSINIKNYRSLNDSGDICFFPEINKPISIIGYNNSGKSNLLRAIFFVSGAKWIDEKTFKETDFHNFNTDECIAIRSEFNHLGEDTKFSIICRHESLNGSFTVSHKDDKGNNCYQKTKPKPVYLIEFDKIKDQLKIRGDYGNLTLLGKKVKEIKEDFKLQKTVAKGNDGKDHSYSNPAFVTAIIKSKIEPSMRTDLFKTFEENIKNNINSILSLQNELEISFDFPTYETFFDNLKFNIATSTFGRKVPIENTGNGFVALFVIALFESLLEDSGNIFLIDEPETFLHEHYQEHFYNILKKLSQKNQIIYTTHSKKFVDIFSPKSIIRIKNENFEQSCVIQPKKGLDTEIDSITIFDKELKFPDEWGIYINTIEPNLGNLPFSDRVIICEGCHDKIAYKTVLDRYLSEKQESLSYKNIAILSAEGKDTIKILIDICRFFHIPYFAIHDLDLDTDVSFDNNLAKDSTKHPAYTELITNDRTQYTKNWKIFLSSKSDKFLHRNKRKLETVLKIEDNDKSSEAAYFQVKDKSIEKIKELYPGFLHQNLFDFIDGKILSDEYKFASISNEDDMPNIEDEIAKVNIQKQESIEVEMPF
jgi:putative ATP-dependent endonuclease of the OLD family